MKRTPKSARVSEGGAQAVKDLLRAHSLGDATPELSGTPERVSRLLGTMTAGYTIDVKALLAKGILRSRARSAVVFQAIPIATTCPHHLTLGWGTITLGFQPDGRLLGLGAVTEAVRALSRRLVLQEELTDSIAEALQIALRPTWVACRARLVHGCMVATSASAEQIAVVTTATRGLAPPLALDGGVA